MSKLDAKQIYGQHRDTLVKFKGTCEAIFGCTDLPEDVRKQLQPMRDELNAQLEKLQPLEQIEAAQQANYALENFGYALTRMQELFKGATEFMNSMKERMSSMQSAANELPGKIEAGIKEKVTAGELVAKDVVDGLKAKITDLTKSTRKAQCQAAGLPENDTLLAADDAAFDAGFKTAKDRKAKLGEKKLTPADAKELSTALFSLPTDGFELFIKSAKPQAANSSAGDPTVGASGEKKTAAPIAC